MAGELDRAIEAYRRSIEVHPTAEAHTYLGWTYSFQGKLDEAMAECMRAIEIDPEFGNPVQRHRRLPDAARSPGRRDPVARAGQAGASATSRGSSRT